MLRVQTGGGGHTLGKLTPKCDSAEGGSHQRCWGGVHTGRCVRESHQMSQGFSRARTKWKPHLDNFVDTGSAQLVQKRIPRSVQTH